MAPFSESIAINKRKDFFFFFPHSLTHSLTTRPLEREKEREKCFFAEGGISLAFSLMKDTHSGAPNTHTHTHTARNLAIPFNPMLLCESTRQIGISAATARNARLSHSAAAAAAAK